MEVGVIRDIITVGEVWVVNEMPVALGAVALTLDVISEVGALSEGVVVLIIGEFGILRVILEVAQDVEGLVEDGLIVTLEDSLSSSRN